MNTVKITTEISLDLDVAAKWFSNLSDDDMAQFFVKVAAEMKTWELPASPDMMLCHVGHHLATCKCSSEDARQMLRDIVWHMDHYLGKHNGEDIDARLAQLTDAYRTTIDAWRLLAPNLQTHRDARATGEEAIAKWGTPPF